MLSIDTNTQLHPIVSGDLITRIVTDKQAYHIKETVYYRHEYYNPNPYPVSFTPPRIILFKVGYYGEEKSIEEYSVPYYDAQPEGNVTIPPFGVFYPLKYEMGVSVNRVGFYEISFGEAVKVVRVLP